MLNKYRRGSISSFCVCIEQSVFYRIYFFLFLIIASRLVYIALITKCSKKKKKERLLKLGNTENNVKSCEPRINNFVVNNRKPARTVGIIW